MTQLRILWVGGLDRAVRRLEHAAAERGHVLEVHTGDVRGRGSEELARLVERADVVVIVVAINSHGGVLRAKALARRSRRPIVLVRRPSVAALHRVLAEIGEGPSGSLAVAP